MDLNSNKTGKTAKKIELSNAYLRIIFSSYGASVRKLCCRKENGTFKNIAFTLPEEEACSENALYAGATLAPAAGRIANGMLNLDCGSYRLTKNEAGKHHLHGGAENLSFAFWEIMKQTADTVIFSAALKDGTDGYPGNRVFSVEYTLKDNTLEIRLCAESDRPTYFNLSNHTYFNLNGFSDSGLKQYLMLPAKQVVFNNEEHIPQIAATVEGTEFDFSRYTKIGERIGAHPESGQFRTARGLNHYFLLKERDGKIPACSLLSADKKTALHLYTDAPALVLYSGGFMDETSHYEKNDGTFSDAYPGCAVAIEPSNLPCFAECFHEMTKFERVIRWEFAI